MNWQWSKSSGFGYESQSFPSPYHPQLPQLPHPQHPPHLQHLPHPPHPSHPPHPQRYPHRAQQFPPVPLPVMNPPPPPIAQLLPPMNFLGNGPASTPSARFVHLSAPHENHAFHNTAIPARLPPQENGPPNQSYSPVKRGTSHHLRRNRRQLLRTQAQHKLHAQTPSRQSSNGDLGVSSYQQPKQSRPKESDQTSATERSRLNAPPHAFAGKELPGSCPTEIKAWVDARKANWPSKTNVARKKAAEERQKAAGALSSSGAARHIKNSGTDSSERDLAVSRRVLSGLNARLPGSSPEEVAAWVKARKENWPSRTNVARKLAAAAKDKTLIVYSRPKNQDSRSGALAKLGDYCSSEDDGEPEKEKKGDASASRGKRARRKPSGRGKRNSKKRKVQNPSSIKEPSLLRMLLEREIRQEQSVLLQAFRYIINKQASTKS